MSPLAQPKVTQLSRRWVPLVAGAAIVTGLIAVQEPVIALVLVTIALVAIATLLAPDLATYAVVFILYSNLAGVGVTFHGIPKPLAAAFPLLLAIPLVRDLIFRRESLVITPVFLLLLLYLGVQAVGMAFSHDIDRSRESVVTLLQEGVVLYLLITNVVRTTPVMRGVTWSLLAAGVLMSIVPLFQQATGTFDSNYGGLAQAEGLGFRTGEMAEEGGGEKVQTRLCGPIGEKNRYAQVMLVLVPLGLMRYWGERSRFLRLLALACTASISLGFALAFSRGGAVGLMCLILCMVVLRIIDVRRLFFVGVGVLFLLAVVPQYWVRLASMASMVNVFSDESAPGQEADGAMKRRVSEMLAAVRVFIDHPVIGVGPGMFKTYVEEYGNVDALERIEGQRRAHSLFLEIGAEGGALGLSLFVAMILVTLVGLADVRRKLAKSNPELANLATAWLLALIAYMATGVFLHMAYMRYFFVVLALCGAVCHVASRESARARRELVPLEAS